jgi:polyhydroxyalkanoate synthesis regulator phasin
MVRMNFDDIRKTFDAVMDQLSPAKAQELAKRYLEPGAAKDQVSKTAGELVQLSQRLRDAVRKEVTSQMRSMGAATQDELDALRKRVRDLERATGQTASGRKRATRASAPKTTRKPTAARKRTAATRSGTRRTSSSGS